MNFRGVLLNCHGAEAYAEGAQDGEEIRWTGEHHAIIPLQLFSEPRSAQYFTVQAFGGKKQDREISCARRIYIFIVDRARTFAHACFDRFRSSFYTDQISGRRIFYKSYVVFGWEL